MGAMIILDTIPFALDTAAFLAELKLKPGTRSAEGLASFIEEARSIARPRAMYREAFIDERTGPGVVIGGVEFESLALRKNLERVERVFPYVATCGTEIDEYARELKDFALKSRAGIVKLRILYQAVDYLRGLIEETCGTGTLSAMNPGSGEAGVWPFEQQHRLFSLMEGDEEKIGVTLASTGIMSPDMTVSGIFFPSETTYRNCQLCRREDCPGRRAEFDPSLWESVYA